MTDQEAFEIVVRHARKQGRKAVGGTGLCRYRAPNGDTCFIGALIPDSEYTPEIEGSLVDALVRRLPCLAGLNVMVLRAYQDIHDHVRPERWEDELAQVGQLGHFRIPAKEEA